MNRKTRGIVLHTTRYGESSLIVHSYTEQSGRQSFMVKGVRKSRKNNRSNLFQPLFILDFEVYHKESREIQLVKEVNRAVPLNALPYEITKSTQAIFMAEVLYRVVREEEANPMLFHFLISTIQYLDALVEASPDFHIVFMFQLCKYLGFYPRINERTEDRYFDLASGRFKQVLTDPDIQLDQSESALWKSFMLSDYQQIRKMGMNSVQRKKVLDQLIRYYRLHVEGMGTIKSLEVLHEFFHS